MNPLLLAAALGAAPVLVPIPAPPPAAPEVRAVAPDDAARAVAFTVRVVSVAGDLPRSVRLNDGPTRLTDAQLRAFLDGLQGDRHSGILQAPRVVAAEGQTATVVAGEARTFTTGVEAVLKDGRAEVVPKETAVEVGERFELSGRVADDGAVVARVKYTTTRVGDTMPAVPLTVPQVGADGLHRVGTVVIVAPDVDTKTVAARVTVPAGRHVVIPGPTRTVEERTEVRTPVLSDIPYVSRLFTSVGVGRYAVRTYLVVSATVIEDDAAEVAPPPREVGR
ncbi:hypothetical protein J0H58_32170 [bacterium]|nr:hypothetical protein [bacterium]